MYSVVAGILARSASKTELRPVTTSDSSLDGGALAGYLARASRRYHQLLSPASRLIAFAGGLAFAGGMIRAILCLRGRLATLQCLPSLPAGTHLRTLASLAHGSSTGLTV